MSAILSLGIVMATGLTVLLISIAADRLVRIGVRIGVKSRVRIGSEQVNLKSRCIVNRGRR